MATLSGRHSAISAASRLWMFRSLSGNDADAGELMAPHMTMRWREPSVSTQP
jgi:hypothetical protein